MKKVLLTRYRKFEQWVQKLPPVQRSFVMGISWFLTWFGCSVLLGGYSYWSAIIQSVLGGFIFGGVQYWASQ
jgi:hypothetical protein